jgi:multidrug efflux pump
MSISEPFIRRPVATSLLTAALALAGVVGFHVLPVAPLPQVEFPTISVSAALPGASPETMASAVAAPLERQFSRIAGVTEMTSTSTLGSTSVTLQFDLSRDIDAAARDVQGAINAARGQLPSNLPNNPTYRKVNPASSPIAILSLTSDLVDAPRMYDAAASILQQKLSQVEGVGQVMVGGSALPAVRVELNPAALNHHGVSLDQVAGTLAAANANRPTGEISDGAQRWQIRTTDQLLKADEYRSLILSYRGGAAIRLSDVGEVEDSVENLRNAGLSKGKPAVLVILFAQPGANIIETVDRVLGLMPQLQASIPAAIHLAVVMDRTTTIRASIHHVEMTLLVSISLVILVVFVFLRDVRATLVPSVVVPLSLVGTFGAMALLGYSLDNLSLMALTISTGFVVDDAIVVIENVARHLERGESPRAAALRGAREIGFTVVSMSLSLVAVFIPILLMSGIVGRLFREFAVTLSVAILISLALSLTTTPMMCAKLLRPAHGRRRGRLDLASERLFERLLGGYASSLRWVLRHPRPTLAVTLLTVCVNVYLYLIVPKGFFPEQDTGRLSGGIQGAQDASFQAIQRKLTEFVDIVQQDPAVDTAVGFTGGQGTTNTGRVFVALKPQSERDATAAEVIARLRGKLAKVPGATLFLQSVQDIRVGGRMGNAAYQYTLRGDDLKELDQWSQRMLGELRKLPELADVNTDQQNGGLEASLAIDRDTASRLGVTTQAIDDTLYSAFGQRQVSTIYSPLNQYHVVMEVAPRFWQSPDSLKDIYVSSSTGAMVPLSVLARFEPRRTSLAVNHQGQFPAVTLSFNVAPGVALGQAVDAISATARRVGLPPSVRATFQGTAQAFQSSLANEPALILAALVAVYIVLGILYESYIHPITILSTLPSAGVGAILALLLCGMDLSVIALVGILLLIGIVKKNAIMMIDFAVEVEGTEGKPPEQAIYDACLLRFRPILMTTMAALLGGLPLALGTGTGSEFRRPLGITIVGGLMLSQLLTLYTTPVVYLYLDSLRLWFERLRRRQARAKRLLGFET